eukprot:gene1438-1642_t
MPPIDLSGGPSTGKNRISLLEGAIITWTKQIRSVLKQDPEFQLKQGLHPTPDVEIEFWKNKAGNLNSIFDQLQGPKIRRVLRALDQSKSTYCTTFARLCKEVFSARMEANDNTKYLRTLEIWFHNLNNEDDFPRTVELFKPMLHIILLIWKNSKHYNTPARLVVLMREICNSLIAQATKYVSGEQIFTMIESEEANQAVTMLKTTLHVCGTFKSTYFDYKNTANAECPANPWKIQNNALFMRLDSFLERCHDILDLTQTIVQFSKLAKIEVGGTKGKTLTTSIKQIYDDFLHAVAKFKAVPYDIMDVGAKEFDDDFYEFRCSIKELERRLGAVVSLAFDDCATVYGRFKLLDSFEGLLERPIIQDELEKKYVSLVQSYGQDLKTVQELFLLYRDNCPIAWNLPPIAGALTWCRGLEDRIRIPMQKLQQLERSILEREEAKEVSKVNATITASLSEFEGQKTDEWGRDVVFSSHAKLKLPLLTRNAESRLLTVNFDPALVRLLREVKYFLLLGLNVPEAALEIYQQVEVFRRWTGNLDLIVNMNNDVLNLLLPVEKPLVHPYLTKFDAVIERGLTNMNWKSSGISEFIADAMEQVTAVSEVVRTMKENMRLVNDQLAGYNKPLMVRKTKPVVKEEFEREHKNLVKERYADIKEGGRAIHSMVKDTNKVLRVSNASNDWRAYVDFVNNVVVHGLANVITTSLEYLYDQINPEVIVKEEKLPIIEIKLDLVSVRVDDVRRDEVKFVPDLYENAGKGIRDLVNWWIGSFFNVATLFKRLDNDGTYLREMHGDQGVCMLLAQINECLLENEARCMSVRTLYDKHAYLWTTDMTDFFQKFRESAQVITEHGQDLLDLKKYDEAISKYEGVRESLQQLQSPMDVGWLRINTQPIKSQLMTWTSKWIEMFMSSLKTTLVAKLSTLDGFMAQVTKGLDRVVDEDGPEGKAALMAVMEDIRDEVIESLESHQMELQTMIGMGKFVDFFRDRVLHWQNTLGTVEDVLKVWVNVSRSWGALESIFLASADIRSQLPDDTKRFEGLDSEFKELMKDAVNEPNVITVCSVEGRQELLQSMMSRLDQCQKSLNEYLDQKKKIFPRFYFVSNVALLDMLANGTNPPKIMKYLGDCYDSLSQLTFVKDESGTPSIKVVNEMVAKDRERLPMSEPFVMEGEVERYLNSLTDAMILTLKLKLQDGYNTAANWEVDKARHEWLFHYPAQTVVTGTQIYWTEETEASLEDLAGGQEDAVKRYLGICDQRLQELIKLVLGSLSSGDRTKIITLITLDVHARDVVQKLIDDKVEGLEAFLWQQQLRFYWAPSTLDTDIRICDFKTKYFYEWIGNTGRLVITPLTDRCYVTLTMGLRLFLGGAPAGPAGT